MYLVIETYKDTIWDPPYGKTDTGSTSMVDRIRFYKFSDRETTIKFLLENQGKMEHNYYPSKFEVFEATPLNITKKIEISI